MSRRTLWLAFSILAVSGCAPPQSPPRTASAGPLTSAVYFVSFEPDSAVPTPAAQATLASAASEALAGRRVCLQPWGDIDETRSEPYRGAMSIRRATAVQKDLMSRGVAVEAIAIRSDGSEGELMLPLDGPHPPLDARLVQIWIGRMSC